MRGSGKSVQHRLAVTAWRRASEDGTEEGTARSLSALARATKASPRLRQILLHPAVDEERKVALAKSVAVLDTVAESVLRAAIRLRAIAVLGGISREYAALAGSRARVVRVSVWTADRLDRADADVLRAQLETALSMPVRLEVGRQRGLIGGLLVKIGEKTVDGTVKGAFDRLERKLLEESSGRGKN
jgi:F-type H+-transporting ATPase subunit delta